MFSIMGLFLFMKVEQIMCTFKCHFTGIQVHLEFYYQLIGNAACTFVIKMITHLYNLSASLSMILQSHGPFIVLN